MPDNSYQSLQQEVSSLRAEIRFFRKLCSNPDLPGRTPIVIYSAWVEEQKQLKRGTQRIEDENFVKDDLVMVYRGNIAAGAGISEQSVSDNLRKLDDAGILKKKIVSKSDGVEIKKEMYIRIEPETMRHPESLVVETNYGGRREKKQFIEVQAHVPEQCNDCQSENIEPVVQTVCHDCGTVKRIPSITKIISVESGVSYVNKFKPIPRRKNHVNKEAIAIG